MNSMPQPPPRLAIVDDHPIVRSGTRQLLEIELGLAQPIAEFDSGEALMRAWRPGCLDLLVLDLTLPDRDGLVLLSQLRERDPELHIVVFSMHESPVYANQTRQLGAHAFVSKREDPVVLVDAVRACLQPPTDADTGPLAQRPHRDTPLSRLTEREHSVFLLLARGHSVERIARTLTLSPKTVYRYRIAVLDKLGCRNDVELASMARGCGVI
ncbi:MAG: response regulator transcription factor [Lysobacteraceae bacterium]|jgi:DNA-binding NarL/FixJ family response regulator